MRILFISCGLPYPLDGGGQNLIYHWLEAASTVHDVDLLVIGQQTGAHQFIPGLPKVRIHFSPIQVSRTLWRQAFRQGACLVRSIPATSLVLMPPAVLRQVNDLCDRNRYDLIILTENGVAGFAPLVRSTTPVVLLKHSVHAVDAADQRRRKGQSNPRWILEERIVRRFEAKTCRAATVVCCVNQEDAEQLISRYQLSTPVVPIALGVDLNQLPRRGYDPATKVIGFIGNLSWGANADAVQWFVREVLPRVWQAHPDVKFLVVGPGGEGLRSLSNDTRIQFAGRVANIKDSMSEVTVGVVPVISGTGVRCKLLDMLSMEIPTISTSLGAQGLCGVHGQHWLIADRADSFASSVETLLFDANLRRKLATCGRELARNYSWVSIYPKILDAFDLALRRHSLEPSR
jgi:glycosyltransferase involved in cell wall biosynthesis